ncbi:MAG: RNA 3'-terminal phosphate cyclase [Myxococcales bacterium]
MIVIDGSQGEGGGQIVRTSLALSLVTGKAFRIEKVRAGRAKPGLMRQHLTAVEAAQAIGGAHVEGAAVRSGALTFTPGTVKPGSYTFSIGTAGSATLVLQTVLPALLRASGPSTLVLEGGTHNPLAPPFDFLARCFLPLVSSMGPRVTATLQQPGFYPAGGGRFTVEIAPAAKLAPLELVERGPIQRRLARALVAHLPPTIAHRELEGGQGRARLRGPGAASRGRRRLSRPREPLDARASSPSGSPRWSPPSARRGSPPRPSPRRPWPRRSATSTHSSRWASTWRTSS